MSAVLKSLLVSCAVLSMAALSFADEPAKSVLDGGRPLAPSADAPDAPCDSCDGSCAADTGCASACEQNCCSKGCGLFKCHRNACNDSCSSGCADSCKKHHGCWLHQGGKHCGHGCGNGCDAGCDSCGCGKHGHFHGKHGKHGHCGCDCYGHGHFCSRCNMIPHIAYINPLSSYYYFRPYQAFHVRAQQDEVITYGGDPRNPYANLLFDNLYAELEAAWAEEEAGNLGSPFEDEVEEDNVDRPAPPAVDPPTPNDYSTSNTPASRLPTVRQAKPLNADKQASTAALPSAPKRVFRVKK